MTFATLGTPPTLVGLLVIMWPRVSHRRLWTFVGLAMAISIANIVVLRLLSIDQPSSKRAFAAMQVVGGVVWGMLPWLAMPSDPNWHMFCAALMLGVLASNVLFSSHFRSTFYGFAVPATLISAAAFAVNGTSETRWGAALIIYAGCFSVGLSHISRVTDVEASVQTARANKLADGLATANRRLTLQAASDPLTGIANRQSFTESLDEAMADVHEATSRGLAVAYLDLDGFKQVNDMLGHGAGDELLIAVSRRLGLALASGEVLARMGGDELTVLAADVEDEEEAREFGTRLLSCFEEPFTLAGRRIPIGCSVGVSLHVAGMSSLDLIDDADTALYVAKAAGGGQVAVHGPAIRSASIREAEFEDDLAQAIASGHIATYFQPAVDLRTGRIVALEALPRWEHVDGVRDAATFIETAGRIGVLDEINQTVLDAVASLQLQLDSVTGRALPIGVNVDPTQLKWVTEQLADWHESDVNPFAVAVIEITERTAFTNMAEARRLVDRLRDLGVRVVLDDFGTGFSSLAIAMELQVDGIKLDHKFVNTVDRDDEANAVVASVVGLAERLGVHVVAEGIETEATSLALRELGVRVGQGYYFAPAVSVQRLVSWLAEDKRFAVGGVLSPDPVRR